MRRPSWVTRPDKNVAGFKICKRKDRSRYPPGTDSQYSVELVVLSPDVASEGSKSCCQVAAQARDAVLVPATAPSPHHEQIGAQAFY